MALLSSPLKQRVRSFLTDGGAPPSPNLSRNNDQIFALLQRKRDDDEFWTPLTELLRDLVESAVQGNDAQVNMRPEARLLALWDVNELAKWLRIALPHADAPERAEAELSPKPRWTQLTSGLSPNALGLFLLLSLAASACDSAPEMKGGVGAGGTTASSSSSQTGGQHSGGLASSAGGHSSSTGGTSGVCTGTSHVTADAGVALPANCCSSTASDLWNAIDESSLKRSDKETLYACLVNLNANWCDGLVQIFKTASPTEIADYLNQMLACCTMGQSLNLSGDFATKSEALLSGMLCMVTLYKGVTFPS